MKQCKPNPWLDLQENHKIGSEVEGEVKSITEFGLFIGLPGEMDGLIHLSDLAWNSNGEDIISNFKKGDLVKAKLLEIDVDKERVSLGVKQLTKDPMADNKDLVRGNIVTSVIKSITEKGLHVEISEGVNGFVKKSELAKERGDQRVDRFAVDEKIDGRIMSIDSNTREVNLSIKALQVAEEKQAMKDYGSVDSGASLGDILGAALEEKANNTEEKPKAKKTTKASSKKALPKKTIAKKASPKKTEPKEKKSESKK
jgi:small subunit ribosomal protein S1